MKVILRLIKTALPAGLFFGALMSVVFVFTMDPVIGPRLGMLAGVLFGVFVAGFTEVQHRRMHVSVFENESVVFQGPANHFMRREGRGGWLTLTATRVAFRSHGKNVQNQPLDIGIASIASAVPCNTALIIPNGLKITLRDGGTQRFAVSDHKQWARLIAEAVKQRR